LTVVCESVSVLIVVEVVVDEEDDELELEEPHAVTPASERNRSPLIKRRLARTIILPDPGSLCKPLDCNRSDAVEKARVAPRAGIPGVIPVETSGPAFPPELEFLVPGLACDSLPKSGF
jgi:hypothetical protein